MTDPWAWWTLAGLGAFHGVNPAMGWLFAVALGLQERSRAAVLRALLPIALGHAISIGAVVALIGALRTFLNPTALRVPAAVLLIGFGVYRLVARHRARPGMQVGFFDLTLWSFLMATAHGAGLMLVPVLLGMRLGQSGEPASHAHHAMGPAVGDTVGRALAAIGVHTLAMLLVAGLVAVIVYEWVGVAFLRRGWVNLDLLWIFALIAAGAILLVPGIL